MACLPCVNNDRFDELPPRERVAADPHWRAAHTFNSTLPGWLVLVPRRHVTSIADLTDAEAAALGIWQVRLSRALRDVIGCAKTYVMQFAEQEGFEHIHFHIVPRMPNIPDDHRGPAVFHYLVRPPARGIDERQRDDLATRLRDHLARAGS